MTAALALVARIEADLAELRRLLDVREQAEPASEPEAWLAPCEIAGRLGIGESYIRKLCARGARVGEPGIDRSGGRWIATIEAIERLRRVSGAF